MEFKSKFDTFLASSSLYGSAKHFHFDYARRLVKQAEKGVENLVCLARLHSKLHGAMHGAMHRERKAVRAMKVGRGPSLVNGYSITGLLFLHGKLCAAAHTDNSVAVKDIQDEFKTVKARAGLKNHPLLLYAE